MYFLLSEPGAWHSLVHLRAVCRGVIPVVANHGIDRGALQSLVHLRLVCQGFIPVVANHGIDSGA
jgi:hypothetical protein